MSVALMLAQGIPRLDHLTTYVTLETWVIEVEPLNVSRDVRLALGDLSTDGTVPRLLLVLPHHATDPSLQCRHQL